MVKQIQDGLIPANRAFSLHEFEVERFLYGPSDREIPPVS